jgi:phosphate transport system substrate-binding protein
MKVGIVKQTWVQKINSYRSRKIARAGFRKEGSGDLYRLAGGLHILVNRPDGKPLESWLKEYLRLALSKEDQNIIASMTKRDGFIPHDLDDVTKELANIQ